MNVLSTKINIKNVCIVVVVVVNFFFPKGGFKVGNIPITWGYLIFYTIVIVYFFQGLKTKFENKTIRWKCIAFIIPFQIYTIIIFLFNGYEDVGWTLSFLLNIIFIPTSMIIILGNEIDKLDLFFLHRILRYGIVFLCIFGIIHFIYGFLHAGESLEIPYITINGADEDILNVKHNNRGGIYKLISTYNNGNIFGTSMLLILPFYEHLEKSKLLKILVKVTLFLTIARTVWIGLLINELLRVFYAKKNGKINFTVIIRVLIFIFALSLTIYLTSDLFFSNVEVLDPELGGRSEQLEYFSNAKVFPSNPFTQIAEILYLSIIKNFGIIGIILFVPFLFSPIILNLRTKNIGRKVILIGLINYVIIAGSDGAFQYLPVMLFYWFIASLSLRSFK